MLPLRILSPTFVEIHIFLLSISRLLGASKWKTVKAAASRRLKSPITDNKRQKARLCDANTQFWSL